MPSKEIMIMCGYGGGGERRRERKRKNWREGEKENDLFTFSLADVSHDDHQLLLEGRL